MKLLKRLLVIIIVFSMTFGSICPALADDVKKVTFAELEESIQMTLDYYKKIEIISGNFGDWESFAINSVGDDVQTYGRGKTYLELLEERIREDGVGGQMTDYERITLGILSAGGDPTDFAGVDLIDGIVNWPDLSQGINAAIWGLIALDAANAVVPEGANHTRDSLIEHILANMSGDGWNYSQGSVPDVDMTGMGLYALAPYRDRPKVNQAGKRAIRWLSDNQLKNGGYHSWGTINSESCSQVICALTSWGVDPQGPDFTKEEGNVVTALLDFQVTEGIDKGGFKHMHEYGVDHGFGTHQALYALGALKDYFENGRSTIFYKISYSGFDQGDVTALEIYPNKLQLEKGKTFQLGVTNQRGNFFDNSKVNWSVSDKNIATIDDEGVLKTRSPGSVNVLAKLKEDESIFSAIRVDVIKQDFEIQRVGSGSAQTDKNIEFIVTNISDSKKSAICIMGLYDKDTRKLVQMNYFSKEFAPEGSHKFESGFNVPEDGDYEMKVLLWDDWYKGRVLQEALLD